MFVIAAAQLLVVLAFASPAFAQDTRTAQLERQRAEKATRLKPYQPTKLEGLLMQEGRLRRLLFPHNGFFVEFGYSYKPVGAGVGFGGGWRHDLFGRQARVVLEAGGTPFRLYQMARADFSLPRLAGERLELGVEGVYRKHPQEDFFGLGLDTTEDMRVTYLFKGHEFQGRAIFRPLDQVQLGTRFGTLHTAVGPGTDDRFPSIEALFDDDAAPGLLVQPDYLYGEAFATFDNRDEPGNARAGGKYEIVWRKYSDSNLDRYSFQLVRAHGTQFVPIFDKKRVFAVQAQLVSTAADDGNDVPFFMQPTFGGGHSLRSVNDYRFRDRSLFGFNIEYRWEAFSALDMALFTDFGTVAPRFSDLDFGELKTAYGIGFRFNTAKSVLYRIDIGTGAGEGFHYFFKFSNVF